MISRWYRQPSWLIRVTWKRFILILSMSNLDAWFNMGKTITFFFPLRSAFPSVLDVPSIQALFSSSYQQLLWLRCIFPSIFIIFWKSRFHSKFNVNFFIKTSWSNIPRRLTVQCRRLTMNMSCWTRTARETRCTPCFVHHPFMSLDICPALESSKTSSTLQVRLSIKRAT